MATRRREEQSPEDHAPETDQGGSSGYNPFLKVEHVNESGPTRLDLTGWVRRTTGRYGPQIVIEVVNKRDGRTYDLGIKEGSPNHRMMFRGMGMDEKKWAGYIIVEIGTFKMRGGRESNRAIDIREVQADNPPF